MMNFFKKFSSEVPETDPVKEDNMNSLEKDEKMSLDENREISDEISFLDKHPDISVDEKGYLLYSDRIGKGLTPITERDDIDYTAIRRNSREGAEVVTIPARIIEGIQLNDNELENNDDFWGQHSILKNNERIPLTEDDFSDLASKIPEVSQRLESGESLQSIMEDQKVKDCAYQYFDRLGMIAVIKIDDQYLMTGGGRHRIIAAAEMNLDIPVLIVGEYKSGNMQETL